MNLRTVEDPYETYNNSSLPYRMIFSQKNKSSGSCFINDILYRQQGWTRTHSAHYYEKKIGTIILQPVTSYFSALI